MRVYGKIACCRAWSRFAQLSNGRFLKYRWLVWRKVFIMNVLLIYCPPVRGIVN